MVGMVDMVAQEDKRFESVTSFNKFERRLKGEWQHVTIIDSTRRVPICNLTQDTTIQVNQTTPAFHPLTFKLIARFRFKFWLRSNKYRRNQNAEGMLDEH